ncbi:MAG: magnesium/cobalt efflux protein [Gammaproteobacteria bacterium RIFCSPHIGHO2_12_FULL_35_23]|nr:MAG: magnesium/cobalt efflux protein [Gammaproteobacteria bacterium RIFCSPHIGHO2_12_FULL_35_23]
MERALIHFNLLFLIIVLILLILVSAFFSCSETGMMALNRYRLRHKVREGNRTAQRVQRLLERPDRLLGVILIGNTFANIFASALATVIAVKLLGEAGIIIATILLTFVILIFGEITPKTLAALYPEKLSFIVSFPLWILLKLLYPLVWCATSVANGILRLFNIRVKNKRIAERLNKEELRTVIHESITNIEGSKGKEPHREMLLSVLDLENITVNDMMIPRNKIIGIDLNDSWEKIVKKLILIDHAQVPIYYGSIEKVVGIFPLRDALQLMNNNRLTKKEMVRVAYQPYFVPEGTPLHTQLQQFRDNKVRLALVVDEYGDILGLVTVKDILEEIVGELDNSVAAIQSLVIPQSDGSYLVSGSVSVRELNKFMSWNLPVSGPKTLSGLIIEELEAIPESMMSLIINGYRIEVLEIKANKVVKTKVYPKTKI